MSELNEIRKQHQGRIREAGQIYFDEGTRELFNTIQQIRAERDLAILAAIEQVNADFKEKLREAEENHAFDIYLMWLT